MKKRNLLLMLLLAIGLPWAAMGQTIVEIGTDGGTTTNSYLPAYTLYNNTLSEQIYTAEEVTMAGTISSISFYNGGSTKSPEIKLYLVNTDKSEFTSLTDWLTVTADNLVFDGTVTFTASEWTTIEFTNEFEYNGTSNLGLVVDEHMQYSSGLACRVFTSTGNCSMYHYDDDVNFDATNPTSGYYSNRVGVKNQIKLEITPAQSGGDVCEKPATLVAEDVTGNSATLTWTGGSGVYNIELNGTIIEENYEGYTYSLRDLAATTAYTAKVQSVCDGTTPTSSWKSVSFTTPCASYDIPYTYDFEEAAPFACWTPITGVTRGSSASNAHSGTYYIRFSSTTSNLVALPQFNEATNNLRVEFWTRPEGYTYSNCGTFSVGYMTDITDASTFVEVANYAYNEWTSNTHVKKTVDFNNAPANANIAFRHNALATNYFWYVDDVTVKEIPSCVAPTGLAANVSATSAELSWTANSGENAWTLYWKKTSDENYTVVANANSPYLLNGLTAGTDYQFYVVANCSADETSEPSEVFPFTTECVVITITDSWSENFNSLTAGIPNCWDNSEGTTTTESYKWNYFATGHEGAGLRFNSYTNSNGNTNFLKTPTLNFPAFKVMQLSFWYKNPTGGDFSVYISTDGGNTYATLATGLTGASAWTLKEIVLTNYVGAENVIIEFKGTSNYGSGDAYIYLDDVAIVEAPSCLPPTALDAANVSTTSAELSWTANSNETSWTLYWKESGATDYTEVANATNPYTLNGLTPATDYQFYVVANCSADNDSEPSEVYTFVTECGIITIDATHSWEEGFESYNVGESAYSGVEVTDIQCWARVQVNSSTHSPFVYRNYSSAASTGLASLEMKTNDNIPVMVALPEFSESIDNLNVAFNYNCTNTNTTYTAELGYITDVTDASTFTKLFDIPIPVSRYNGHSEYSQDLYENAAAANAPAGSRVAILISNTIYSPVPSWNFDDFVVSYVSPCRKPANLALVEGYPTAHEVSFTWDAEEGEMFEYAMLEGTITDFSDVNWGQAEETNTASWNNLDADQNYTLALRKVCGGVDGYSPVVSIPFHTTQEPASIPFADDFEDGQKWALVNGDLTNAWAYGEATHNGGTHALYISNDGGTTNAYSTTGSAAMVYATKLFTFEDGVYKFSYDWNANGESTCDYLRVALVPATVTLQAGTSAPSVTSGYFYNNLPEGWIALDGGGKLNLATSWQSYETSELTIAAGNYMMVFAWTNDGSVGTNPPAAIDNVSITKITCITPTNLAYANVKSNKVDLTWTSDADAWQICINDDEENLVDVAASVVTIEEGVVAYTLTGLTAETPYTVKVRANCGSEDGVSEWSSPVSFTTIAPCSVEDVTITNITHYAATVNWTGESAEGYTVNYRTAATASASPLFSEDFENETSFANWTFTSMNTANNIESGKAGRLEAAKHNGSYGFRFSSYTSADDYNQYLVSPELTVTGVLKFFYKKTNDNNTETLQVGYSTTTNDYETAFTWIDLTLTQSWQESADITLPENVKYIAFHYYGNYAYYVYVDDITISKPVPAGEWQTVSATSEAISANLSGLTAGTTYDLQVVPNCDETLASETQQFSTVPENVKWFITEGNWGTATNWEPTGVPTIEQDVTLMANTTIESGCVAEANIISTNTHTLTIEDGGQLKHNNSSYFTATVKKNVTGYGADNYNTNNGYVLIGLPCSISLADDNSDGVNLRTGTYDLYTWSSTADLEWINHGSSDNDGIPLALSRDDGFLYANQEGAELIFTGDIYGSGNNYQDNIFYTAPSEEHKFSDWNLIGNPFVCDAYLYGISSTGLESTLSYYKMNDAGNGFEAVEGGTVIAPMQGIFCQAPSGSYYYNIYFTRTAPVAQNEGKLNMNLRSDNKQLDNAILVFGGEQQMGKMTFRANSSKIYMPVEGKDYAITSVEGQVGEVPVSFKAENNGSYSLSFTSEEVSFSYLHLIDNMTGADVNLLQTPSYTFDARTSDYESRFRLVFATGSSTGSDTFGFVNASGNFCIFGIEGEATVQVIDVLGHVLSNEQFSGSYEKRLNVAPGVYVIRLIQGNDIRVQKMVVR